jgi:diguanylate cyclase (GGDEF)-like protein
VSTGSSGDAEPAAAAASSDARRVGRGSPLAQTARRNRFTIFLWSIIGCGLVATLASAVYAVGEPVEPWQLGLALLLCLGADRPLLEMRYGHNAESFTWAEACVVIGLVLVPPPVLAVCAAVAVLVFHLAMRRSLLKASFNAMSFVIGIVLAAACQALVLATVPASPVYELIALALAALAFSVWNGGATSVVVALAEGLALRSVFGSGRLLLVLICFGNIAVGVTVVALAFWSRPTLVVLPPLLGLMYSAYRGYLHAIQERDVWQQLESAARELNSLDDHEVAAAAVARATGMLKADWAEIVLDATPTAPALAYSGTADGLDADYSGVLAGRSLRSDQEAKQVFYSAPLEGPLGRIGTMRVGFREVVDLTKRELHVLRTFAHSVSTTMQNARLYSEMRQHADAKAHEASHDGLTGLGNRALLHDRAVSAMASATHDAQCGLLVIDLDHFKEINDTLGHAAGDVFLKQVAQRISSSVKDADAVCRLGGDEFAVLISGLRSPDHADAIGARLLEVLSEPVGFDGLRLSIEGSVGVACYPADSSSFDELLRRADVALYQAKGSRGSVSHYRADRDESSLHRLELAAELRSAMAEDQFVVHYQPQYDLGTGAAVGAEALVRWQHPERGLLGPAEFIGAVEHSGLIRDFTLAVLEKAVAECAGWLCDGTPLTVAVNLSARNLLDSGLPGDVGRVLSRHGLPAHRLVLEITETTMMSELDVVEEVLGTLRGMGVQLSVDDFGTGYSSLAFLQRVAVNEVKIDRTFVLGVATSESDRALVRATVQLAHSLGARAVGEGVEDEALAVALRELGCDFAQGYHLGRPVPAPALRDLLGLQVAARRVALPAQRPELDGRHLRAVATG